MHGDVVISQTPNILLYLAARLPPVDLDAPVATAEAGAEPATKKAKVALPTLEDASTFHQNELALSILDLVNEVRSPRLSQAEPPSVGREMDGLTFQNPRKGPRHTPPYRRWRLLQGPERRRDPPGQGVPRRAPPKIPPLFRRKHQEGRLGLLDEGGTHLR